MDSTLKTIIIMIIILLIILCIVNYKKQENFTNDEAIQNVASLYNQAKLSVTDLTSTGISTLNTVNANGNLTSNGNALFKNGSWLPYTDGNNYITSPNNILRGGPTTIQGDLNVSGNSNLKNVSMTSLSSPTANISNLTITPNNIPVIPLQISPININQSWTWDNQIWAPKNGIGNIIFPAISAKLRTVPIGSIIIFSIMGNPTVERGQAIIITYKISDTQYSYSPLQGQILSI
jgi:competence protein ComGC